MNKDVIYIDLEDDITSIIEKVKNSQQKIVALVPPKRIGVLQSAVNLKLLHKAGTTASKHLVLITSDNSLTALAAGIQMPVAKNLQSRPEIASLPPPPIDEGDDVIEGGDIAVGEHAGSAPPPKKDSDEEIELPESLVGENGLGASAVASEVAEPGKNNTSKKPSVPNFSRFRKRLLIIGGLLVILIAFLIWAIIYAPHATVNIKAKTSEVPVDFATTLDPSAKTNPDKYLIQPASQQIKKTNSLDFNATGKKEVGKKASGVVTLTNCASRNPTTVPAGTALSTDGLNFLTASSVTIPGGSSSSDFGGCDTPGVTNVSVSAQKIGEEYNLPSGKNFTVAGEPSGVGGSNRSDLTGGSKKQVTVISASDVATAKQKVADQDKAAIKQQLSDKFDSKKQLVIDKSFAVSAGDPSISPGVGTEASSGHITQEITYSLLALSKNDLSDVIKAYIKQHSLKDRKDQQVYDDGLAKLKFSNYTTDDSGTSLQLTTDAQAGPIINTKKLKPQLVDKNYEEIRQKVKQIDGVEDVDTNFTPFWVSKVSGAKKITIKFTVSKK